jgi:pSer/pThr/pTyr-binding forkhead associated (FHA) protein
VEDLGSTNGTYLNQRRVTSPAELRAGDRLRVGKTTLELRR